MSIDKESVKKMFPNLVKELEGGENKVSINAVRSDTARIEEALNDPDNTLLAEAGSVLPDKFRHYTPTVIDFIRRCDTEAQAEEIISYMHKKREITKEFACKVLNQLKTEGLRSFGPKKEDNYYFENSGLL